MSQQKMKDQKDQIPHKNSHKGPESHSRGSQQSKKTADSESVGSRKGGGQMRQKQSAEDSEYSHKQKEHA